MEEPHQTARLHRLVLWLVCAVLGHKYAIVWVDTENRRTEGIGPCLRCKRMDKS